MPQVIHNNRTIHLKVSEVEVEGGESLDGISL